MHLATLYARAQIAVDAPLVTIESHLGGGLPSFNIVGLPEAAVKESKDRVRAALSVAQFEFPARRITVNLAPADQPKSGGRFDLGIALSILAASGQLPDQRLDQYEFLGELALGGALRPVRGVLAAALKARDAGRALIVPRENAAEAAPLPDEALGRADAACSARANQAANRVSREDGAEKRRVRVLCGSSGAVGKADRYRSGQSQIGFHRIAPGRRAPVHAAPEFAFSQMCQSAGTAPTA